MIKKFLFLVLSLLLSVVGCTSFDPYYFIGTSTTWADYPTRPDPMPAEAKWYVASDSLYAELTVKSKSRGTIIDIPNREPLKFFLRRGEWRSKKLNGWEASVRQIDDSLWISYGVGDGGVYYKLKRVLN
jgi:hypothetical protein